jgi:hypothetical protein
MVSMMQNAIKKARPELRYISLIIFSYVSSVMGFVGSPRRGFATGCPK